MTPEDVKDLFRSAITEWHEEVTVKADFLNEQPEVLFIVKGAQGPERLQAGLDLRQATYIRDGLNAILEKFKEGGYEF